MDQEKLTAEIARRVIYAGREVEIILKAFTDVVGEALKRGESVKLTHLGRFVVIKAGTSVPRIPFHTRKKRKTTVEFVLSKRFIFPKMEEEENKSAKNEKDEKK